MKYLLFFSFLILNIYSTFSQDTIIKINNKIILADVFEITEGLVKYIENDDPERRLKSIQKAMISHIIYENNQIERFPRDPRRPPFPKKKKKYSK